MLRRFLEFAIDKPLLNHILLAFILMLSIFAYINIPKEIFPPMSMDKVSISGGYAGTSADVLDKMVVKTYPNMQIWFKMHWSLLFDSIRGDTVGIQKKDVKIN